MKEIKYLQSANLPQYLDSFIDVKPEKRVCGYRVKSSYESTSNDLRKSTVDSVILNSLRRNLENK